MAIPTLTMTIHFKILLALTLIFLLQSIAFLWIGKILPDTASLALLCWFFVLIFAGLTVVLNLASLALFYLIRLLGGSGNFAQTKTAVYWSSLCTIPVGLFFLSFIWSGLKSVQTADKGVHDFLFTDALQFLSALGMLLFSIYGLVILTKKLSEIHRIKTRKTFAAISGGLIATCLLAPLIFIAAIKVI